MKKVGCIDSSKLIVNKDGSLSPSPRPAMTPESNDPYVQTEVDKYKAKHPWLWRWSCTTLVISEFFHAIRSRPLIRFVLVIVTGAIVTVITDRLLGVVYPSDVHSMLHTCVYVMWGATLVYAMGGLSGPRPKE